MNVLEKQGRIVVMHGLAPLVYDLALMLGVAGIVAIIFQRIHQPIVLGYLVAGMIIGPNTPPYSFIKDTLNIQTLSQLGSLAGKINSYNPGNVCLMFCIQASS